MNTIHTTFNKVNTSYTVIGNKKLNEKKDNETGISALILNRGGRPYRHDLYNELLKLQVDEVLSIELGAKSHFDLEKESVENENLKFLILKDEVSPGEMINIGVSESSNKYVIVLWDDMIINSKAISYRVFDKIITNSNLCTVPLIFDKSNESIPTFMTPLFHKELLKVVPLGENNQLKTLYPFMYVGLYNKDKFIQIGGYDIGILNTYWQKLDFGLRTYMWGEKISAHKSFIINLGQNDKIIEDITPDKDYRLYCLKNLSVVIKKDSGYLPIRRFFPYYEKSGSSLVQAIKEFRSVRKWVKLNKYRFKINAHKLTELWDKE